MTKQESRSIYKQKRLALTASERLKMDDLMLIQLQRMSFNEQVRLLLSYWPIEQHAEPNTHLFTYYLENHVPQLQVCFPVIDFATSAMKAILVHEETDFVENQYGIPEPEEGDEIMPAEIDIVLVPLLAFDKFGFRVGYGKGFYDRYLALCKPDVITIGFSYFEPVDKIDDTNPFDVPLNYCITPQQVYEF
jgi:5-formyltetrahydrofolate cyclo-ligase